MGVGLVFWGVAEPLTYYLNPPVGFDAASQASANFAFENFFMHWGILPWANYAVIGLALAYFMFRKNKKGLLSVIAVWLAAYTAYNIMMSSSVYYIMYCLCRPDLISVYMLDVSLIGLLGIVIIVPLFMKLFHKTQKAFAISQVAVIICDILIVIFHGNMAVLFICSGVASMFATASMPFSAMMMTEMTDLVLIDSGRVVNGTMAALKGFSNKAGIAISSAIVSFTLAATGYIANAIGQEPQAVITGITVARFVVPVICGIVIILALVKYPITDEVRQKVRAVYEKQHTENK